MATKLNNSPSPQPSPSGRGGNRENHGLNIAVIGGGYAGMAAAAELAARDIPVTVYESAKQLGGRARGVVTSHPVLQDGRSLPPSIQLSPTGGKGDRPLSGDSLILDNGQHLLLGCYSETLRLIELVGGDIAQDFLRLPLQLDLHKQFSLKAPRLPAPLHLLVALMNAQGLDWSERLKAARFMLTMRFNDFRLQQDMTVSALLALHGQDTNLSLKLWEPLCIAALNTPIHKASAQVLLNVLRDSLDRRRADSDMLLPRLDFTALFPQRAADFVASHGGKVLLAEGVESVSVQAEGVALSSVSGTQHYSHIICATSPTVAARLLSPIATLCDTVAQIEALEQQPIYTVYLQYPEQVHLPCPMLGLHQCVSQWLFDKGQIASQHGLLAAVISAEGLHQDLSQEALAQKVIAELQREFGITDAPLWYKVIAEKRATFCCSPNLQRPSQQTSEARILLAGDYTAGDYPATLEGAVISGVRCASLLTGGRGL